MAQNSFKIGDVVRLKSGGPDMTIYDINGSSINCVWFKDDEPIYREFIEAILVLA